MTLNRVIVVILRYFTEFGCFRGNTLEWFVTCTPKELVYEYVYDLWQYSMFKEITEKECVKVRHPFKGDTENGAR